MSHQWGEHNKTLNGLFLLFVVAFFFLLRLLPPEEIFDGSSISISVCISTSIRKLPYDVIEIYSLLHKEKTCIPTPFSSNECFPTNLGAAEGNTIVLPIDIIVHYV